jgi:hypothetical protein
LLAPASALGSRVTAVYFCLSLLSAAVYGVLAVQPGFSDGYVVQDDARQHIFWMRRFQDPELSSEISWLIISSPWRRPATAASTDSSRPRGSPHS